MQQIDYRLSSPLLDAFEQVQDGKFLDNIANTYGISNTDARIAVDELVPALTRSIRGNIATRQGLASFLDALATGNHAKYLNQDDLLTNDAARQDGNGILGHLLGSKEVSRAVTQRASFGSGIGGLILQKLLPYVASILMGMIAKRMGGGGGGGINIPMPGGGGGRPSTGNGGGWFGGGGGSRGGLDDLLGDLSDRSRDAMGGSAGAPAGGNNYAPDQQSGGGANPFDRMRDMVNQQGGGAGGNAGGMIRDMMGNALGGKSKGIMGSIVSFLVYRYGWSFVKRIIGRFLGR